MIKKAIALAVTTTLFLSVAQADGLGSVNGEKITKLDVEMTMGATGGMKFETLDPAMKKRVLDMIVEQKLLTQEAAKTDVAKSAEYKEQLEALKRGLVLDVWMKQEMKKVEESISKKDIEAFYKKNEERYKKPKELKARHILVKTEDEAKKIIETLSKAKDGLAEFIKLAKEKSTGPSGKNGGDLGWFPLNRMVPEFSTAADKLKKGEFTKAPVKTQFGYHIIYLDDRKKAGAVELDKVAESIKQSLVNEKFGSKIQALTKKLREKAKIELAK